MSQLSSAESLPSDECAQDSPGLRLVSNETANTSQATERPPVVHGEMPQRLIEESQRRCSALMEYAANHPDWYNAHGHGD